MQGSTTEDIMRFSITRTASIAAAVTTLAGCGVATAAGTNTHTISAPTAVTRAAAVPSLTPAQVRYEHRSWGDPKTEVGVIVWTPANWRMVKLSTFEAEFISPNALWNLRINGSFTPGQKPVKSAVDAKIAALKATKGLRIISRVDRTTKATSPYSGRPIRGRLPGDRDRLRDQRRRSPAGQGRPGRHHSQGHPGLRPPAISEKHAPTGTGAVCTWVQAR
jgi:hypothetical protein